MNWNEHIILDTIVWPLQAPRLLTSRTSRTWTGLGKLKSSRVPAIWMLWSLLCRRSWWPTLRWPLCTARPSKSSFRSQTLTRRALKNKSGEPRRSGLERPSQMMCWFRRFWEFHQGKGNFHLTCKCFEKQLWYARVCLTYMLRTRRILWGVCRTEERNEQVLVNSREPKVLTVLSIWGDQVHVVRTWHQELRGWWTGS